MTIMFVVFAPQIMIGFMMFSFKSVYRTYKDCIRHKRGTSNALNLCENLCDLEDELKNKTYRIGKSICFLAHSPKLREVFAADFRLRKNVDGLDFLGYIIRPNYILVRNRVINNFKYKKAKYLTEYEKLNGDMRLAEIKRFLSLQASFKGHCSHANSYRLIKQTYRSNR